MLGLRFGRFFSGAAQIETVMLSNEETNFLRNVFVILTLSSHLLIGSSLKILWKTSSSVPKVEETRLLFIQKLVRKDLSKRNSQIDQG